MKLEPDSDDSDDDEHECFDDEFLEWDDQNEKDEATLEKEASQEEGDQNRFVKNIQYLLRSKRNLTEVMTEPDSEDRKDSILFQSDNDKIPIKKVTLLYWLTTEGKKVSTDRQYRFMNSSKVPDASDIHIGDYIHAELKGVVRIMQVIKFKFCDGKKFHGDVYKRDFSKDDRAVSALCSLFNRKGKDVTFSNQPQKFINVTAFKAHAAIERDLATGKLSLF